MRRSIPILVLALAVVAVPPPALADPFGDLSVRTETDDKRNTIYYLVNTGEKTVKGKLRMEKFCTSVANAQKPVDREYWIRPGEKLRLGMSWSRSTCRRTYRVVEARYV